MEQAITPHWIDGAAVHTIAAGSVDPATGAVVGRFAAGGVPEAQASIAAARRAFEASDWPLAPRLRQRVMLDWAAALHPRVAALAELLTRENGKPLAASRGEILGSISEIEYYAGLTRHIPGHVLEPEPGVLSTVTREPAGVAAVIVPWNAPGILLVRGLCPALAAGCTTIVKPAHQTALFNAAFLDPLLRHPQIPPGVVNVFAETGHDGAKLLAAHAEVDVICFTGSTAVGKEIMRTAADTMKKLSLELGGKSCAIVLPDADVYAVAQKLAAGVTIIAGQQCTAVRRVLAHADCFDAMKAALAKTLDALAIGNGLDDGIAMGPLIDIPSRDHIAARIAEACEQADEVVLRGTIPDRPGAFLTPTLVHHQDTHAFFMQEEIFGPFVTIERFADEAEAVQRANHTTFGLSASVWTNDGAAGLRLARALRNGTVWINEHNKLFPEAETGGFRQSGIGRLHGYDALADFTELKHIYQAPGVVARG
jgi:acyl-CoA reductase-like NAD-dependent aldehyde dehydrogenase